MVDQCHVDLFPVPRNDRLARVRGRQVQGCRRRRNRQFARELRDRRKSGVNTGASIVVDIDAHTDVFIRNKPDRVVWHLMGRIEIGRATEELHGLIKLGAHNHQIGPWWRRIRVLQIRNNNEANVAVVLVIPVAAPVAEAESCVDCHCVVEDGAVELYLELSNMVVVAAAVFG